MGSTEYSKYLITLSKKVVEESNLLDKELKVETRNNKIVIEED